MHLRQYYAGAEASGVVAAAVDGLAVVFADAMLAPAASLRLGWAAVAAAVAASKRIAVVCLVEVAVVVGLRLVEAAAAGSVVAVLVEES